MDSSTWILIAVIAVAVLIVLGVIGAAARRRSAPARQERRRTEFREITREAELKAAEADRLDAEARLRAAQAEEKSAIADLAKADARREVVLAGDDQHRASLVARDAAQTQVRAERMDPDRGADRRPADETPGRVGQSGTVDTVDRDTAGHDPAERSEVEGSDLSL
jgi:hypothetical protein